MTCKVADGNHVVREDDDPDAFFASHTIELANPNVPPSCTINWSSHSGLGNTAAFIEV